MAKDYKVGSDTNIDTRNDASNDTYSDFGGDIANDEGVNLNRSTDNTEKDNVDDLMGASSMCNADEMQEELDLNQESSNYTYQNEDEKLAGEQFIREHPELYPEPTTWNEPNENANLPNIHNPDSDSAVIGPYNHPDGGPSYTEVGDGEYDGEPRSYFNNDTYDSDAINAHVNGEDQYGATGNYDAIETMGSGSKNWEATVHPDEMESTASREFQQIQEATGGIAPDDISQDENDLYHIDTGGTWISPEDRNAEYNDAYEDDKETGNYVDGYETESNEQYNETETTENGDDETIKDDDNEETEQDNEIEGNEDKNAEQSEPEQPELPETETEQQADEPPAVDNGSSDTGVDLNE